VRRGGEERKDLMELKRKGEKKLKWRVKNSRRGVEQVN
jgi:hypothetical protein